MSRTKKAAALIIGDEILSGRVSDENTPYLARRLHDAGVELKIVVTIPDSENTIALYIRRLSKEHDYLFTSGGLGLTHDDLTLKALARAFDRELKLHRKLFEFMRRISRRPGEILKKYCVLPEGAEVNLDEEEGTYYVRLENVFVLPGIPMLFRKKYELIHPALEGNPRESIIIFLNLWEEEILQELSQLVENFPDIKVGSYPVWDSEEYKVYIVLESYDRKGLKSAADWFKEQFKSESVVRIEQSFREN